LASSSQSDGSCRDESSDSLGIPPRGRYGLGKSGEDGCGPIQVGEMGIGGEEDKERDGEMGIGDDESIM